MVEITDSMIEREELIQELKIKVKGRLQTLCESAWDDEEEMIEFLFA